ncbi:DUF3871 family protein [Sinomicrobium kalidii]|uniref:DUF3871 family protein n=1 Tax=Sinomicrobium kalidii TaxID=2900738 RepID=UPI001E392CF1|nr:DUF3871 family protein [Sinomicrobium kalidii]UGU14254.1 DUF3871 family protein [Sinomicrobium kalidii]
MEAPIRQANMELKAINSTTIIENRQEELQLTNTPKYERKPFIEANTNEVSLSHLKKDCIIPVFSKDNEKTIAHQEFIEIAQHCASKVFPHHTFTTPEVRVSHQIKGRVPSAIHKPAKELLEHEKTIYYERMAFIIQIPSITEHINGNDIALTLGGVRAYNQENLYSKKTFEKFKFFIGFQNMVCCNMCVASDGYAGELKVDGYESMKNKLLKILQSYNAEAHLKTMKQLGDHHLTEHQFAQIIGKARLYNFLPKKEKSSIPPLTLNDGQLSTVAKDYYQDESFCRNDEGDINLWRVYNLFTQANKSSYIDTFLDRNVNAFNFSKSLVKALNGDENYHWFLS